jgi:hypothetical protein
MFRKGQYFSFDAIIASVIFMIAVVMLLSYWHSVKTFLEYQSGDMSREAMRIAAMLLSPPSPSYALGKNCGSMQSIGLVNSFVDKTINESTLECLQSQQQANSTFLKSKFATPYNVAISVTKVAKAGSSKASYTIGTIDTSKPSSEIVKIRRIATLVDDAGKTSIATIDVYLYK